MKIYIPLTIVFLFSNTLFAQNLNFEKAFSDYNEKQYEEKVYLHLSQGSILAGEKLFVKAYCTNVRKGTLSLLSKVAYVEILDGEGNAISQEKIRLDDGLGNGEIPIPTSAKSGNYIIRSYTRWMKNFSPNAFFYTTIRIINSFNKPYLIAENKNAAPRLSFYPEGGHLINGLTSKIAFEIQGPASVQYEGYVVDESDSSIAEIKPGLYGLGSFSLTPNKNTKYRVHIKNNEGRSFEYDLPEIHDNGVVMEAHDLGDKVDVKIRSTMSFSEPLHVLIHANGKVADYKMIVADIIGNTIQLDKNRLTDGVSYIQVFLPNGTPCCERMIFKSPSNLPLLRSSTDKSSYTTRQKVNMNIENGADNITYLSSSVYKVDPTTLQSPVDIISYSLLSSAIVGDNRHISEVFNLSESKKHDVIDLILMTRGWSKYNWEDIKNGISAKTPHLPEYRQHILRGKLYKKGTKEPAEYKMVYLGSPGKMARIYGDKSDDKGNVYIELTDFYDQREIVVQPWNDEENKYDLELVNPFSQEKIIADLPHFMLQESIKPDLEKRSLHMQIMNVYTPERILNLKNQYDSLNFYMKPDNEYYLDKYTRFRVMEEVMREYVAGVLVRRNKDDYKFLVYDATNDKMFNSSPLLLLDGIPVPNENDIIAFNPLLVKRVDVVNRRYFLGDLEFPGIVSCFSYTGKMKGYKLPEYANILMYKGVQSKKEFYVPAYHKDDLQRIPDYRHQLYWNSDIEIEAQKNVQLGFYTSDVAGKYIAITEGLTKEGLPMHTVTEFEVKGDLVNK